MALCLCEHTQRRHDDDGIGMCKAGGCGCSEFRAHGRLEPVLPVTGAPVVVKLPAAPAPAPRPSRAEVAAEQHAKFDAALEHAGAAPEPKIRAMLERNGRVFEDTTPEPELTATHPEGEPLGAGVLEALLERGQASSVKRTRGLTERVLADVVQLRRMLEEEAVASEVQAEVARLEAELAAARARLRASGTAAHASGRGGAQYGTFPCPHDGCTHEPLKSAQGLGAHRFRAHGYRKDAS